MAVYLINILLILVFGYLFLYKQKTEQNTKIYCGIVAIQWILISGLRHVSIGDDTEVYYHAFEQVKSTSWKQIFSNIGDYIFEGADIKDPGYALFEKIFQIFCKDHQVYLLFIATLFTVLMARWVYKNSKMPAFSFILYSALFYSFYSVTGHRQTIATALIVFWGYEYIKEKKLVKFLILAFVAFLFHKSSIVFVPFYFIANIPITPFSIAVSLLVIAVVTVMGQSLYGAIAGWLGYREGQITDDGGGAETYAVILILVSIVILFCYCFYKDRAENPQHLFNITLLTLMSSLLVLQNQGFMRIQQYYSLFLMISFPEVILSFDKKGRTAVYIASVTVLILYLIRNNPQYMFFWQ